MGVVFLLGLIPGKRSIFRDYIVALPIVSRAGVEVRVELIAKWYERKHCNFNKNSI